MKKLIAVSALMAAFAAFAEAGDYRSPSTFEGGSMDPDGYWVSSNQDGSSAVKEYGGDNLAKPTIQSPGSIGYNYLELSTEGGTLWRGFETGATNTPKTVSEKGLYVDTLVQFTPTEDGQPPELGEDDKLAIWLNVQDNVTNLCVRGNAYSAGNEGLAAEASTFVLAKGDGTALTIDAGKWYRLTVKAIQNALLNTSGMIVPCFQVLIDGEELKATTAPFDADMLSALMQQDGYISSEMAALASAGKLIPSLQEMPSNISDVSLTAVGFKGSGAIDDLVLTDVDPFKAESIDFMLNWPGGVTPVAYTINGGDEQSLEGETSGFKVPGAKLNDVITLLFRNNDGATKKFTATVSDSVTSITATEFTYGWPEYLGDAVDGAYEIDDEDELVLFQKGVNNAKLPTADTTFKLTDDIALTDPWPGVGVYNVNPGTSASAFHGTFDGAGHRISNVVMADTGSNNYRGFFTQLEGATVKDLTVATTGFGANPPDGEYGAAAVAGYAYCSTLQRCVAEGTIASGKHNVAGIVIRVRGSSLLNCTNKVNITGNYTKVAGIAVLTQNEAAGETTLIDGCVNEGTITCANGTNAGRDGCAGILAYIGTPNVVTIKDCVNTGSIVKGTGASASAKIGQIVAYYYRTIAFDGANKGTTDQLMINTVENGQSCLNHFATVDGNVATLVADAVVALDGSYKVMAPGAAYQFTEAGSIAFDNSLVTTFAPTVAEGLELSNEGYVWTAAAPAPAWPTDEGWDDVKDVDDAVEDKLDTWKSTFGVTSTVGAAKAFLLNVAPGGTLPELKIESITVDGTTATVVVSAAEVNLANVNGILYVESSNNLTDWTAVEYDVATTDAVGIDGKATFTVKTGKFMKAKIGFKTPVAQ